MKKAKIALAVACVCLSLAMVCGQAQAGIQLLNEVITMKPGESTVREFPLFEKFDISKLGPMELFLLIGTGDNETKVGDLTLTLKPTVTKTFGSKLDFCLIGFDYPLGGKSEFFSPKSAAPLSITKVVKMRAIYGIALVGAYIKNITDGVDTPAQFSLTFSWAVGK